MKFVRGKRVGLSGLPVCFSVVGVGECLSGARGIAARRMNMGSGAVRRVLRSVVLEEIRTGVAVVPSGKVEKKQKLLQSWDLLIGRVFQISAV